MIVNYKTDENGRLQSITTYPLDEALPMLELPDDFDLKTIRDYIFVNGEFSREVLPNLTDRRIELERNLAQTDYIVAKAVESLLEADSLPSLLAALKSIRAEYADVLAQRAEWRAKINKLEEKGDDA
nr:MAG TPA: hypothetical protein [Caudoviricetes sp.]